MIKSVSLFFLTVLSFVDSHRKLLATPELAIDSQYLVVFKPSAVIGNVTMMALVEEIESVFVNNSSNVDMLGQDLLDLDDSNQDSCGQNASILFTFNSTLQGVTLSGISTSGVKCLEAMNFVDFIVQVIIYYFQGMLPL